MPDRLEILDRVRRALTSEPRIGPQATPVAIDYADGALTLEGEVGNVAAKKLALQQRIAHQVPDLAIAHGFSWRHA